MDFAFSCRFALSAPWLRIFFQGGFSFVLKGKTPPGVFGEGAWQDVPPEHVLGVFFGWFSGCLVGVLGASWGVLGAFWGVLGASWGRLGASWGSLGAFCGRLGVSQLRLGGVLGRHGGAL